MTETLAITFDKEFETPPLTRLSHCKLPTLRLRLLGLHMFPRLNLSNVREKLSTSKSLKLKKDW